MRHLSIDIETKSSVDIGKAGLYRYAQSDDFEILLFAYRYDSEEVQVIDLAQGEKIPESIADDLKNPRVAKHAYNAAFEWYCLNHVVEVTAYDDAENVAFCTKMLLIVDPATLCAQLVAFDYFAEVVPEEY
ncbi:MAG: PF13754 domain-containing protein, partial [Blautia faecis]|nr:PF13754 domain-containing protein [Blautia faecis]